ncbi:MAG: 16S rRNA (adenine(1518)-N(6)/adenine(1519)-N(6))-dimethyltransferase RsmA [Prochlorothrix sp.]|nr:16S rRNA (adenine(1518)-N(6)/adenine(1519)-N(6))-dimethyltransferase RsmA [Prochlorothrix sp.]
MSYPRKRFGQHWLRDPQILHRIVAAAHLQPSDRVLEIGPGRGVLTEALVAQAEAVVAVELDRDLCQSLTQRFGRHDNFILLQGDILRLDLTQQLQDFPHFHNLTKVVANIPYNITGPILELLLGKIAQPRSPRWQEIVLLVQKEVADRVCAAPGSKTFGALSVRCQYLADCEIVCAVPPQAFKPPPKVDSAVLRLVPRPHPQPAQNPQQLEALVKVGFGAKRKMLRNNLKSLVERDRLDAMFEILGIDPTARAETLGVSQWIALSDALSAAPSPASPPHPAP